MRTFMKLSYLRAIMQQYVPPGTHMMINDSVGNRRQTSLCLVFCSCF